MPVSSPSYFPPERGSGSVVGITAGANTLSPRSFLSGNSAGNNTALAVTDLIVIGWHAFDAGTVAAPVSDADLSGTIVIGNNAAGALTNVTGGGTDNQRGNVIAGTNALAAALNAGANVILGDGALATYVGIPDGGSGAILSNVMLGTDVGRNINGVVGNELPPQDNVFIGFRAAYSTGGVRSSVTASVIIGSQALESTGAAISNGSGTSNSVVIGYRAGRSLGAGTNQGIDNVIIGGLCCAGGSNLRECVYLGSNVSVAGSSTARGVVCIGNGASAAANRSVVIGAGASADGDDNIILGPFAQTGVVGPFANRLVIGIQTHRAIYGALLAGNILLGDSIAGGTLLDFTANATNVLKLLNGTIGTGSPVGGGYFYVSAGALHWVGSAGTDTPIAPA